MKLNIKTINDSIEIESTLELLPLKLSKEDLLNILYKDITEAKINNVHISEKNNEIEKNFNKLLEENKTIKKENEEIKKEMKLLSEENKKLKTTLDIQKEIFKEFKYNHKKPAKPENLRFIDYLTNHNINSGFFEVFTGLTDNKEYLIYNNKNNFNLDIMTLKDKALVKSIKGHDCKVGLIRYFIKEEKEEYLLSCDNNKVAIIWDIQNDYNKKYTIKEKYFGNIFDAILIFNIEKEDYLILSSGNMNEYTKLYELREDKVTLFKNIYGTNKNNTNKIIPWEHDNKHNNRNL